jgi:hypothetical protein
MAANQGDLSGAESVGGVRIDVGVNTAPLKEGLNDGKKATENFANSVDQNVNQKAGSSVQQFADKFKNGMGRSIETLTSLIGKVTAVIGVFTLFYNIGRQVNEMLKTGADRAEQFSLGLDLSNQAAALDQTSKKIQQLEADLAGYEGQAVIGKAIDNIRGTTAQSIKTEIVELRKTEESLREAANATRARLAADKASADAKAASDKAEADAKAASDKALADAKSVSDQIIAFTEAQTRAELEGISLIQYERNKAVLAAEELRKKTTDAGLQDDLARSIEIIQKIYEKKVESILDEEREARTARSRTEREAVESAQRQAQALADSLARAFSDAFKSIQQQQTGGFDQITASVQRIAEIVERLERNRR